MTRLEEDRVSTRGGRDVRNYERDHERNYVAHGRELGCELGRELGREPSREPGRKLDRSGGIVVESSNRRPNDGRMPGAADDIH